MSTTLIALHGRKGSGKDATFKAIERWAEGRGLTAARRGFADLVKISAMRALGWEAEDEAHIKLADHMKNEDYRICQVEYGEPGPSISFREFLQRYGTEAHRDVFGENFWVDALLPLHSIEGEDDAYRIPAWPLNFGDPPPDIAVITDLRFENEANRVILLKGSVVEIERPMPIGPDDTHASEQPLSDAIHRRSIPNTGTLEDLDLVVRHFMEDFYTYRTPTS